MRFSMARLIAPAKAAPLPIPTRNPAICTMTRCGAGHYRRAADLALGVSAETFQLKCLGAFTVASAAGTSNRLLLAEIREAPE
jgi:hypothetical protein